MNGAHLHLILNHIPLIGLAVGFLLLLIAMIRGLDEVRNASLWVITGAGIVAIPAYLTGEPAEKVVKALSGIAKASIEQHEDIAMLALIASIATAAAALAAIFFSARAKWLLPVVLVLALASTALMAYTANIGGLIRHSEISATATTQNVNEAGGAEGTEKKKDRDDH